MSLRFIATRRQCRRRVNMERKHWALLVLDAARPGSLSPLQIQKILFLMNERLSDEVGQDFYHFVPYNYGPFAPEIYADLRLLVDEGLARNIEYAGRSWVAYEISEKGTELASQIKASGPVSKRASEYIAKVVRWVESLTFTQLLSAIYKAYPQYATKSVFAST